MLEDRAKRASVRDMIISTGATIGCLQETKINNWTHNLLVEAVGVDMASNDKKMIIYIFASADWLEIFPRSKVLVSC
jgi:hypothetical protein